MINSICQIFDMYLELFQFNCINGLLIQLLETLSFHIQETEIKEPIVQLDEAKFKLS